MDSKGSSRKFQIRAESVTEAEAFQGHFYRKFGYLSGLEYFCSETSTDKTPGGPIVARVGFIRWPYPLIEFVDFDTLLAQTKANDVSD